MSSRGDEGEIVRIWRKPAHGRPMEQLESCELVAGFGIDGGVDCGPTRQVTLIEEELWAEATSDLGAAVDPAARRANFLVRGIDLVDSRGRTLLVGDCRLEVAGETRPCQLMDEMHDGLRRALEPAWRGGAYCRIRVGGRIAVGDRIRFATDDEILDSSGLAKPGESS